MMRIVRAEELPERRSAEESHPDVMAQVREILRQVREEGDSALRRLTARFDGVEVESFRIPEEVLEQSFEQLDEQLKEALRLAEQRIRRYHEAQKRQSWMLTEDNGTLLGQWVRPLERVGVYVPGGRAAYPSTVLMNVIPAQVAGVEQVVMVTPPHPQGIAPAILATAHLLGVREVYGIGGAQAIAALAYGTESIAPVDKIVGPGNLYVALAKQAVFGRVAIDMIAGPSEVVIVGDGSVSPRLAAADLLAQAEHDPASPCILVSTDEEWAKKVLAELEEQLSTLPRQEIARKALESQGCVVLARDMREALEAANRLAPEHLQLLMDSPWEWVGQIKHAGGVFLGPGSPVAVGDYIAGTNHVLPTSGTARFASPLGVDDFVKRMSFVSCSPQLLSQTGPAVTRLARTEGLEAHARSIEIRGEE